MLTSSLPVVPDLVQCTVDEVEEWIAGGGVHVRILVLAISFLRPHNFTTNKVKNQKGPENGKGSSSDQTYLANSTADAKMHARVETQAVKLETVALNMRVEFAIGRRRERTVNDFVSQGTGNEGGTEILTQAMGLRFNGGPYCQDVKSADAGQGQKPCGLRKFTTHRDLWEP